VIGSFDVTLKILRIEIDLTQRAISVARNLVAKVNRFRMAALAAAQTALAVTLSPNSTIATKLLPLVP
jgi:hypothetical protein